MKGIRLVTCTCAEHLSSLLDTFSSAGRFVLELFCCSCCFSDSAAVLIVHHYYVAMHMSAQIHPDFSAQREMRQFHVYCMFKMHGCRHTMPWSQYKVKFFITYTVYAHCNCYFFAFKVILPVTLNWHFKHFKM